MNIMYKKMKKLAISAAFMLMVFGGLLFSGCVDDDFDTPEPVIPHVDFAANKTITELLAMHPAGGLTAINTDVIVKGVVVANDESGNLYKQIYLQDAGAGLQIQLNATSLYSTYKVGQRVYVKCKGLALGEYGGNVQLGVISAGAISRIPADSIPKHLFIDSLPGAAPAPILLTLPPTKPYLNMLVKFEGLHFADAGAQFAPTATTNHNMLDASGHILPLRTSNYATFAKSTIPSGTGTVTGILSWFSTGYQFYIRDLNDLSGFSKK